MIPKPVSKNIVLYTVVRALVRVYGRRRGRRADGLTTSPATVSDPG